MHLIFDGQGATKIASGSFSSIASLRRTDLGGVCVTLAAHGHKASQPRGALLRPLRGDFGGTRLADVPILALSRAIQSDTTWKLARDCVEFHAINCR